MSRLYKAEEIAGENGNDFQTLSAEILQSNMKVIYYRIMGYHMHVDRMFLDSKPRNSLFIVLKAGHFCPSLVGWSLEFWGSRVSLDLSCTSLSWPLQSDS